MFPNTFDIEQVQSFISEYEDMIEQLEWKAKEYAMITWGDPGLAKLKTFDFQSIDGEFVRFEYYAGCNSYDYMDVPTEFFTDGDYKAQLAKEAERQRKIAERQKQQREERQRKEKEERERKEYERLQKKFGNANS